MPIIWSWLQDFGKFVDCLTQAMIGAGTNVSNLTLYEFTEELTSR